jgi:rod shape-determining protein MreC
MKRKLKFFLKIKYVLMILTILLLGSIVVTYSMGGTISSYKNAVSSAVSPIRNSIHGVKRFFSGLSEKQSDREALLEQVASLEAENEDLQSQLDDFQDERYELNELRDLLELKDAYSDYPTVGATVIAKNTGNWFYEFTIDKGSDDGIEPDMNVLASGGLAGIVTDVGKNYSIVTSIIADDMNVSAVSSTTRDACIVSGDLELLENGYIRMMYISSDANIGTLERIITSTTSSKYLPGILIGYAYEITMDSNELTQSGYLIPAVDFAHLEHVLVIQKTKTSMFKEE